MTIGTRSACVLTLILCCGLAGPATAQAPSAPTDVLAPEGIIVTLPEGFPPFELDQSSTEVRRYYQSKAGSTTIRVGILGPLNRLPDSTVAGRRRFLESVMRNWEPVSARTPSYAVREDSTHLVGETLAPMPRGGRILERTYIPLAGSVTITRVTVLNLVEAPDAAADRAIAAMLDSVRVLTPR
ncbi:MAG TPA: hypothetical protein VEQ60_12050 [Longimicrobium sp.]|nr:hypothetical protein [Longimicrobium sp.]